MGFLKKKKGDDDIDEIIEEADKEVKPLDDSGRAWDEKPEQISNEVSVSKNDNVSGNGNWNNNASSDIIPSRVKADLDEVKSKIAIVRDLEKDYAERFERITERLGNLSEGNRENEKITHNVASKVEKIESLVEDLDPQKIEVKLQKWDSKLEEVENNYSSLNEKTNGLSEELKKSMKKLSSFVGVEAFEKMKSEFEKDISTAKQLDAKIEKNSNKVENMFLEVEEKYQDIQKLKSEFEKTQEIVGSIKKEFDGIKIKVEKYIKKDDVAKFENSINKKFNKIDSNLSAINSFVKEVKVANLNSIKKKYPELVREFKETKEGFSKLKGVVSDINSRLGKAVSDFIEITDKEGIEKLKESLKAEVENAVKVANEVVENFKDSHIIEVKQRELGSSIESLKKEIENINSEMLHLKRESNDLRLSNARENKKLRSDLLIDDDKILNLIRSSEHFKQLERGIRSTEKDLRAILSEDDELRAFVTSEVKRLKAENERSKSKIDSVLRTNNELLKKINNLEPILMKKKLDKWRISVDEDVLAISKENKEIKDFVNKSISGFSVIVKRLESELKESIKQNQLVEKRLSEYMQTNYKDKLEKLEKDTYNQLNKNSGFIEELEDKFSRHVDTIKESLVGVNSELDSVREKQRKIESQFAPISVKGDVEKIKQELSVSLNSINKDVVNLKKTIPDIDSGYDDLYGKFKNIEKRMKEFVPYGYINDIVKWKKDLTSQIKDLSKVGHTLEKNVLKQSDFTFNQIKSLKVSLSTLSDKSNRIQQKMKDFVSVNEIDSLEKKQKENEVEIKDVLRKLDNVSDYTTKELDKLARDVKKVDNLFKAVDLKDDIIENKIKEFIPANIKTYLSKWQKELDKNVKEVFSESQNMKNFVEVEVKDMKRDFNKIKGEMMKITSKNEKIEQHVKSFTPLDLKRKIQDISNIINDMGSSLTELEREMEKVKKFDTMDSRKLEEFDKKITDLYSLASSFAHGDEVKDIIYDVNKRITKLNKYAYHVVSLAKEFELFKTEVMSKLSGSDEKSMVEELRLLREIKQGLSNEPGRGQHEEVMGWIAQHIAKGYSPEQLKRILRISNYDPNYVDEYLST